MRVGRKLVTSGSELKLMCQPVTREVICGTSGHFQESDRPPTEIRDLKLSRICPLSVLRKITSRLPAGYRNKIRNDKFELNAIPPNVQFALSEKE